MSVRHSVQVRHMLPGRIRFGASALLGDPSAAARWTEALQRLPGILSVRCNPRTGSLLIHYDESRHSPDTLTREVERRLADLVPRQTTPSSYSAIPAATRARWDARWAGWLLLLGAGAGVGRLIGLRFAASAPLSLASWLLTIAQGYGISPEDEASAQGDEGIPAVSVGLHVLQGNPVQLSSIYASRLHRYAASHHLQKMPLGERWKGYPPLPGELRRTVTRRIRLGWQGAGLLALLTGNTWLPLAALLAGNPRPARVGGVAVQANAVRHLDEAGMRLAAWPDWADIGACEALVVDAALLPAAGAEEWLTQLAERLHQEGVHGLFLAGVRPEDEMRFSEVRGVDAVTTHAAIRVYKRLVAKYRVALVAASDLGAAEVADRGDATQPDRQPGCGAVWTGPDGTRIELGVHKEAELPAQLSRLFQIARGADKATQRVDRFTAVTSLILSGLASTGRLAPAAAAVAVEVGALFTVMLADGMSDEASWAGVGAMKGSSTNSTLQPSQPTGGASLRSTRTGRGVVARSSNGTEGEYPNGRLPSSSDRTHGVLVWRPEGLTSFEAALRQAEFGPNDSLAVRPITRTQAILRQFREPVVWVLALGAAVSAVLGQRTDAMAMGVLLGANALLGGLQEYRADQESCDRRLEVRPRVRVLRDDAWREVPDTALVPGDVIALEAGEVIPADGWVIEARGALVDESALTGESVGVPKWAAAESVEGVIPLNDGESDPGGARIWAGTHLSRGKIIALVVTTGQRTRASRLAATMNRRLRPLSPLQRETGRWFRRSLAISALVGAGIALVGVLRGQPWAQMAGTGLSLAVAAVPEGLPAILTLAYIGCAGQLRPGQIAVKRLGAVEALGSVTVLCLDKTGTLTRNNMQVERLLLPSGRIESVDDLTPDLLETRSERGKELRWAILVGAGCHEVRREPDGAWRGDPTEVALVRLAEQVGFNHEEWHARYPRVKERPFDPVDGYMAVLCGDQSSAWVLVKGAPERVIHQCSAVVENGQVRRLTERDREAYLRQGEAEAERGNRLLSLAYRSARHDDDVDGLANELIYAGTVSLVDPIRPATEETVRQFQSAGVRTVMITGDHARTAVAVARRLGMGEAEPRVLSGEELKALSDEELTERVGSIDVFARIAPQGKMRIVAALQRAGEVVAVTGDGVNDAAALRQADVGIALAKGSPAAVEAADVLLMGDTLSGIVRCVQEGIRLRKRLRSAIGFLAAGNVGEMLYMASATLLGMPPPLLPSQILLMNALTDALPALGLATEREEHAGSGGAVERQSTELIDADLQRRILATGVRTALSGLAAFTLGLRSGDLAQARTAGFIGAVGSHLLRVGAHRTGASPPMSRGSNEGSPHGGGRHTPQGLLAHSQADPQRTGEKGWRQSSLLGAWGMLLAGLTVPTLRQWFHLKPVTEGGLWGIVPPVALHLLTSGPTKKNEGETSCDRTDSSPV